MRILFTGAAPFLNSGYSKPLRNIIPLLITRGHKIAVAAFAGYQGPPTQMQVPGGEFLMFGPARDKYLGDVIDMHAHTFKADVVITLQDVWVLNGWGAKGFPWLPWMPIDTHPVSQPILDAIETATLPLVWCDWARDELFAKNVDSRVVPLGADLDIYKPIKLDDFDAATAETRKRAGFLEHETFIAGMVAANSSYPSRKSFPEVLQAWKRWVDEDMPGVLYLHTTLEAKARSGVNLPEILETLDLPWSTLDDPNAGRRSVARVLFPNQYGVFTGQYDDRKLADLYRSFNVLLAPSYAEGFGIPIIEAQACGIPVVTLNVTAMPEVTFVGKCLNPVQMCWDQEGGWRGVPGVNDIYGALLEEYFQSQEDVWARRIRARVATDAVRRFDWRWIVENDLLPVLDEIAGA